MKLGVLTFQETNNFGSVLQTYGLYNALHELGIDTEIISYQCNEIVKREFRYERLSDLSIRGIAKYIYFHQYKKKKHKNLMSFLADNATLGCNYSKRDIYKANREYDAFIVGSDLVWALDVTGGDYTYYLDFANESKLKFSYASSANSMVGQEYAEGIRLLGRFDLLSVREAIIREQLNSMLNEEVGLVCDPTMLVDQQKWVEIAKRSKLNSQLEHEDYILLYFPDSNGRMFDDAKYLSGVLNSEVFYINDGRWKKGVVNKRVTSLEDFLCYILNAKVVLSGSYHGTLFSMYFEKEFYYYVRAHSSRMNSLSKILEISNREAAFVHAGETIDYKNVSGKIKKFRDESLSYIELIKEKTDENDL